MSSELRVPPYVDGAVRRPVDADGPAQRVSATVRRYVGRLRREAVERLVVGGEAYEERTDPDELARLVVDELRRR